MYPPLLSQQKGATVMMQRVSAFVKQVVQRVLEGESSGESVVGVFAVLTHVVTILRLTQSCLQWCAAMMRGVKKRCIPCAPRIQHCKLRCAAYAVADSIIDTVQHQPDGYAFWASLPENGQHSPSVIRSHIANSILASLFTSDFLDILLNAALTEDGRPITHCGLYHWLLDNIYSGKPQRLYNDWLRVHKQAYADV